MRSTPTRGGAACMIAAVSLALAGCSGSSGNNAQPGPGVTSANGSHASGSGSPVATAAYTSSSDLVSALKSVGHPCKPVSAGQSVSLKAPGLRSVISCTIGSSKTSSTSSANAVTATVFDDHTDAEAYATLLTSAGSSGLLIGSTSQRAVLGQNWVVIVPDDAAYANQVSAALGGTVLGGATASSG